MVPYKQLEHVSDLCIKSSGRTREELFVHSARGMMAYLFGEKKWNKGEKNSLKKIHLTALDLETLMVDWLSELLYLSTTRGKVYFDFKLNIKEKDSVFSLYAQSKFIAARIRKEIKAVTFHGLKVEQRKGIWQAVVIYDL